ncbi:hypothetical protein C8F04DRAFT_136085, partial [Mycena alexandri]
SLQPISDTSVSTSKYFSALKVLCTRKHPVIHSTNRHHGRCTHPTNSPTRFPSPSPPSSIDAPRQPRQRSPHALCPSPSPPPFPSLIHPLSPPRQSTQLRSRAAHAARVAFGAANGRLRSDVASATHALLRTPPHPTPSPSGVPFHTIYVHRIAVAVPPRSPPFCPSTSWYPAPPHLVPSQVLGTLLTSPTARSLASMPAQRHRNPRPRGAGARARYDRLVILERQCSVARGAVQNSTPRSIARVRWGTPSPPRRPRCVRAGYCVESSRAACVAGLCAVPLHAWTSTALAITLPTRPARPALRPRAFP